MNENLDINVTIKSKTNTDISYTIIEKKYINGILHYYLKSNSENSEKICLSEFAIKDRFIKTNGNLG